MKRLVCFVFLFLFMVFTVSAEVNLSNTSVIVQEYRIGDHLQGALKINISDENINDELKFVFGSQVLASNEISFPIKEFLDKYDSNALVSYTCDPVGCGNIFEVSGNSESSKTFSLESKKSLGFVLNGKGVEILEDGISFDVSSDTEASCVGQLSIDVSADGDADWENYKSISGNSCGADKTSTCYRRDSFDSWFVLGEEPYCEKIKIGKAPAFEVKAVTKKQSEDSSYEGKPLIARIYGPNKIEVGNCELPQPSLSGGEKSCVIEYVSKSTQDHFVCISTKEGSNNNGYSLKARDTGNFCGFKGDPEQVSVLSADYAISVSPRKYDAIGLFTFDDDSFSDQTGSPLVSEINDYISERYGAECPNKGCIIPFIFSGLSQELTINNIQLKYKNSASNEVNKDKISFLSETPAILTTAGFITLDLSESDIALPKTIGNYTLSLYFGNEKLLDKNISIKEKDKIIIEQIHPRIAPAAVESRFIVFVDGNLDVSTLSFEWDFGDGSLKETSRVPFTEHAFPNIGNYEVTVTAFEGVKKIDSRKFSVSTVSPEEAV